MKYLIEEKRLLVEQKLFDPTPCICLQRMRR